MKYAIMIIKTLSVRVAHKEFASTQPNLPHTHKAGWESLIKLLASAASEGYIPTTLIRNASAGGSCYVLSVDVERSADAHHRAALIERAMSLGWDSAGDDKHLNITEVKNYLITLSKQQYAYPVRDIVSSYNAKGIPCTEEEVLEVAKKLNLTAYYGLRVINDPASENSRCMRPMPRKIEEVLFLRPSIDPHVKS